MRAHGSSPSCWASASRSRPAPAPAQSCNFTISNLNFGSINLAANTPFTSTATYSASCTGTANTTVRTCPNIDAGSGGSTSGSPRFLLNGATQLNFNLYQDGSYTSVWGSNLWGFAGSYASPTIDVALNGSGSGSASQTIYGQVWAGQQTLPAGLYASSFSGNPGIGRLCVFDGRDLRDHRQQPCHVGPVHGDGDQRHDLLGERLDPQLRLGRRAAVGA